MRNQCLSLMFSRLLQGEQQELKKYFVHTTDADLLYCRTE